MKARDLKHIVNQFDDNDDITFEYSMFFFENIDKLFSGREIVEVYEEEVEDIDDIPNCDHIISFKN